MSIKVKAVERNVSFDKSKEESYSHFHDGLALQGKGLGVAVFVDLCKSLLGCLVKLQFQYKYVCCRSMAQFQEKSLAAAKLRRCRRC